MSDLEKNGILLALKKGLRLGLSGKRSKWLHDHITRLEDRNTELEQLLLDSAKVADQHYQQRNHAIEKRDELAAKVERLREAIDRSGVVKTSQELSDLLNATPPQNLNEIRRDAYIEGCISGWEYAFNVYQLGEIDETPTDEDGLKLLFSKRANTKYSTEGQPQ